LTKKQIHIKFQNGLTFETFIKEVFEVNNLTDKFDFIESKKPEYIVFGPYGNDIPPKGDYIRIGYYCENIIPDLTICEWAFGIPLESEINHPKYSKIQWHNIYPNKLVKKSQDIDEILNKKRKFCSYIYFNSAPYREQFFQQLSKYKKVDAPGRSMNNMIWQGNNVGSTKWDVKRKFLEDYKFSISFENYTYPGYQTEKLYDPMLSNSIPIYCGDMNVDEIFNNNSFINVPDYLNMNYGHFVKVLERISQPNFVDIRPGHFKNPINRMSRKLKLLGRALKMDLQYKKFDFSPVIDQIIKIDQDPELYAKYLKEPWFKDNSIPEKSLSTEIWSKIFNKDN
jgi:hypothetical protein